MSTQMVTYTPQQLNEEYNVILSQSEQTAQNIASGVDLADLDAAAEDLARVVFEIEEASNKKYSAVEKIPFVGGLLMSAKQKAETEMLKRKTVEEVTNRMFDQLTVREQKLRQSVGILEAVEDGLIKEEATLTNLVGNSNLLLEDQSAEMKKTEIMLCKDVATKASVSLLQNKKNRQVVDVTVRCAMELSNEVSKQLPALKQALNSELTIAQSLNQLRQFKQTFDQTTEAINKISDANQDNMWEIMEDVLDVKARDEKQFARLKELGSKNVERTKKLHEKVNQAEKHKDKMYEATQQLLQEQSNAYKLLGGE